MNNLVADPNLKDTARKRKREKADINYHNYYIKISKYLFSSFPFGPNDLIDQKLIIYRFLLYL